MEHHPHSQHVSGLASQAWAHWEYDPSEWATFDQVDWEPVRNRSRLILILSPIISLVILAVLWVLLKSFAPLVMLVVMLIAAIILLTVLIFLMVAAASSTREAKKRYEARRNPAEAHRVTFASDGVWESGVSFSFRFGRSRLESVKLTANPAVLHFKMPKLNTDGSWTGVTRKFQILVPRGHEAEAEQLRQRYYDEVIAPWKAPSARNRPEPV